MTERQVILGDCVEVMARMEACSVDAVVCDPPYGLDFMGVGWDTLRADGAPRADTRFDVLHSQEHPRNASEQAAIRAKKNLSAQEWHERWAREALRVLKPGGYLLAFGGTRTFHRLACAVEDAGFEIRDRILMASESGEVVAEPHPTELAWMYGSGFPKSLDVSKAIDKAARGFPQGSTLSDPENPNAGRYKSQGSEGKRGEGDKGRGFGAGPGQFMREEDECNPTTTVSERTTAPSIPTTSETSAAAADGLLPSTLDATATTDAERWRGWGTALKPAHEPVVVARKPLSERNVAANVLRYGTGAINVDAARVDANGDKLGGGDQSSATKEKVEGWDRPWMRDEEAKAAHAERVNANVEKAEALGRWPANVVLVHADGCVRVGEKRVRASAPASGPTLTGEYRSQSFGAKNGVEETPSYADEDGLESVEEWECVDGCPVRALDEQTGDRRSSGAYDKGSRALGAKDGPATIPINGSTSAAYADLGGASRFFYTAKASRSEREAGLVGKVPCARCGELDSTEHEIDGNNGLCIRNDHPTVKPAEVMRWLLRLVTPPGGIVLDCFAGSGSTLCAAAVEEIACVGIEQDERSALIAETRAAYWAEHGEEVLAQARAEATRARERSEGADGGQLALL